MLRTEYSRLVYISIYARSVWPWNGIVCVYICNCMVVCISIYFSICVAL